MNRRKEQDICLQEVTPISCFTLVSFTPVCFNAPRQFITLLNLRSLSFGLYVFGSLFFIYLKFFSLPEYHLCFTPFCFNSPCQFTPLLNLCSLDFGLTLFDSLIFFHLFTSFFLTGISPLYTFFALTASYQFMPLNLRPLIFGFTPFDWFICVSFFMGISSLL